ncbi:hypothetical protein DACRYDRAFT_113402 [Dacryopinax primogenitus]|uniref:Uncharacterized protein n=1 Tax=Dacryopinax primogenitus (strain DJM 731) TaxID=1858805 RepID=M5GA74_DACPD|nr:uncharacterized protein DACRYDRAFT_113402 [Dacryopinax primogenitus]EJU05225.1 hypothetical protein DACRYDRAFT_113402 [Dacryopinax primogenitus]
MQAALSILGFAPCHHMASLFETPARSVAFLDALNGKATDFRALMAGFRATVDNPGCDLVPELMAAFPKAKVVLGLRDSPEVWWKSCSETVYCMSYTSYQALVYPIPFLGLQSRVVTAILENKWLARYGVLSGPEVYTRHRAFIRDIVPPDQLLEFNVKEGWEPLCKFLGVPVPDVPFPHTNDSAEVNANIRMAKLMGVAAWTGILAVLGGAFYWGVREEVWKTTFGFLRKLI